MNLVQVTTSNGVAVVQTVGHIAPTWAKVAQGRPVATHYAVTGSQLVQVVSPGKGAKYPVVGGLHVAVAGYAQGGGGCQELVWTRVSNLPVPLTYDGWYCR